MFKKLKKSVIDKNNLLLLNLSKKRINKTPSKLLFPKRTNLTFANIIVNMNSNPNLSSIDSWNNSYFNTELYNNSFSNKSKNSITDISRNISEAKDEHSEILSLVINGLLCLKSNDFLTYCIKLIEIITYIRDNKEKYNYINIYNEINKELLMIIYQIYFQIFSENSFIYTLLKNNMKNGMKIFKKIHFIYILYILSLLSYIHDNINFKKNNINFYKFLKQFLNKEKCHDKNCFICVNAENYEKKNSIFYKNPISISQKSSIIKIMDNNIKKNYNINKKIINSINIMSTNTKNNLINKINNSNDNIMLKKTLYNQGIKTNYYSNIISQRKINKKISNSNNKKNEIDKIKKKIFYNQISNLNGKEKENLYHFILTKNKKQNLNIDKKIQIEENSFNNFEKKYETEKKQNKIKKIKTINGEYKDSIENIKINISKNLISSKSKIFDLSEEHIINDNKITESNKINTKNQSFKPKTIKINIMNNTKVKSERKIMINLNDKDKQKNNNRVNIKENNKNINNDINKSSKIIKENINLIEKEINDFKEHNIFIKQQLEKLLNKSKIYK